MKKFVIDNRLSFVIIMMIIMATGGGELGHYLGSSGFELDAALPIMVGYGVIVFFLSNYITSKIKTLKNG